MSRQSALAFIHKIQQDGKLQERLRKARRRNLRSLVEIAAEIGYHFTLKEYRAALEINGELSPDDLNQIVDGFYVIPGVDLSPHPRV